MYRIQFRGNSCRKYMYCLFLMICSSICEINNILAQFPPYTWGFYHRAEPLLTAHPQDYFHATGEQQPYSGIGAFSLQPRNALPKTLFHLYALQDGLTHSQQLPPSILRLQTAGISTNARSEQKTSSIEFRVGEIMHPFGMEEQICVLKNIESTKQFNNVLVLPKQRGLAVAVQKQGKLGTEQDGMLDVLNLFSERRTSVNGTGLNEWYPRIGIGTDQPLEHLQLGNKFTFHAGGASRIADNAFFDMHEQRTKRISTGPVSSISMQQGSIILGNARSGGVLETVDFHWGDDQTLRGIEIDIYNGMSIGKRYPQCALDIMSRTHDQGSGALRVQNSSFSTLLYLTSNGLLGIYNAQPKERVHIGERFTIHAGGASVLGDNVYFDTISKSIQHGRSASLMFQNGMIQLANTDSNEHNAPITYQSDPNIEHTLRGLIIEQEYGHCGIGRKDPKARLDILAKRSDSIYPPLRIATSNQEPIFVVNGNGNIGIGVQHPREMLHVSGNVMIGKQWNNAPECTYSENRVTVDGSIIAKELLITTDYWADEVFEDSYQLMTLHDLEEFIKRNKHLPEMPTEKEIIDQGIHVSHTTIALLKKIEELTLHLIDLKKDFDLMKTIVDTLPIND